MPAATPLASLPAPDRPKTKLQLDLKIEASFTDLGLNNETKKAEFAADFEGSMAAQMGLRKRQINVEEIKSGRKLLY